ncbi:hypothetical protein DPQ25_00730 [Hydrogeniiclostridium mannosilyticum]|uniref:SipW-cognate class signal peptide n=1 Tax=Hydrogeniiclostridium mannosilyticum TaxID=2764322 RepID=A0A328UDX6_9FIRM|nr:TasA family protein [Hydrogeniiclostridium mannosilyticum]RAQ30067.1 hypothetical protein DPQ25_00730 [Hydrogeniiclostridium mannosilyticum]
MANSKHTKRALLASILSVVLCAAMLVGSTFAWFTDSVTSGNNKIVAGNLDVELEYRNQEGKWNPVTETTKLFQEDALWEPGHTEVVYLRVKNAGTLALKYQLAVTAANETTFTNALGKEGCRLSDYLVFGQVESDTEIVEYATREEAWAAAGDTLGLSDYTKESELYPEEIDGKPSEQYIALVVYMPTEVGNEANYRGDAVPSIDLGVNLVATQTPYEADSFGDNYDKGVGSGNITIAAGGTITDADGTKIDIPANAVAKDMSAVLSVKKVSSAATSVSYDISLCMPDGSPVTLSAPAVVTKTIDKNLTSVTVSHNGTAMTKADSAENLQDQQFHYDPNTGLLTLSTSTFSPFEIRWGTIYTVKSANNLLSLQYGGTFLFEKNLTYPKALTTKNECVIDLQGHTLSISHKNGLTVSGGKCIIKNGTIVCTAASASSGPILVMGDADVTIENCTLLSKASQALTISTNGSQSLNSKLHIKNSTIGQTADATGRGYAGYFPAGKVVLENCDVTGHIMVAGGSFTIDGGQYHATGFNNQAKVFDQQATIDFIKTSEQLGAANTFGDCVLIYDRRDSDSYKITDVTIKNAVFDTEITLSDDSRASVYAVKYVDLGKSSADPISCVLENNTYRHQLADGKTPLMFVDLEGNNLTGNQIIR